MRIVVAPDKFKGSLPAAEVAAALTGLEPDRARCHAQAAWLLRRVGQIIARDRLSEAVRQA